MIAILLAEGFEEIEALGTCDILRRCGEDVKLVKVSNSANKECSHHGSCHKVEGGHGIKVFADLLLDEDYAEVEKAEVVVLPGGLLGVENLDTCSKVRELTDQFYAQGENGEKKYIAAICAAPSLFGKYGYLDGKVAVAYPAEDILNQLTGAFQGVEKAVVCDNVITSRAAGTTQEFAKAIMKALGKEEKCKQVLENMYY